MRIYGLPLRKLNIPLGQSANIELFAKTLDKPHSTEVGNMLFSEGKVNFLGNFRHLTKNTPLGAFLSKIFEWDYEAYFPSEFYDSQVKLLPIFTHF